MGLGVDEQAAFLLDMCALIKYATDELHLKVVGAELARTIEQQQIYVNTGRSKTMNSRHLVRKAIDLYFFKPDGTPVTDDAGLRPVGDYWEKLNVKNKWGGNYNRTDPKGWKDRPHFERLDKPR